MSEYNSMCINCENFNKKCPGTTCELWTGCKNWEQPKIQKAKQVIDCLQYVYTNKNGFCGLSKKYLEENLEEFLE